MNENNGIIRNASVLGVPKMLLLGLQHMFAMFGATILVPILVNSYFGEDVLHVQVTLICAGVGTLLFHFCSKGKVPAFLGSSFAFLGGFATISKLNTGAFANISNAEKLSYACGGILVAGLLYLVLALIIRLIGVKKVMRFLPPVVTGPIIICIGLSLAGSAVSNASTNWLLAFIALATIVVFNIWGKGMFKIIPILMGVVISYIAALIFNAMGMTNADGSAILNFTNITAAPMVGVPEFSLCKFNISAILVMAPIALASMMEHIGDIKRLPDGYNTVLHGGGANLSQGQRQLLAIARAAVADPPVLILDEATSSIDTRTERLVQKGMDALMAGRTSFVIAHRLSTVRNADCIMVMEQGRIIERGTHDQLMEEKGRYYQLYTGKSISA